MIKKIADKVWKVDVDSNVYFLDLDDKIVIDTGPRAHRSTVELFLSKVIDFKKVNKVIFTHLHADHTGNFDLFPNAKFFASKETIEDFKKDPAGSVLEPVLAAKLSLKLNEIEDFNGLKVISTPGHTRGSICIWYEKEKVLFTGDTKFKYAYGRTDLPTSAPDKIEESIKKLGNYKYKVLAPGHDY